MQTIIARNVHQALAFGNFHIRTDGIERESRNGPVLQHPTGVITTYKNPIERLSFWPNRDINTAFLLYEAMWMTIGRRDLDPLLRYVKNFSNYSDDGESLHGAYGYRWRKHFEIDQLEDIASILRENKDDRRCVLQMWHCEDDLKVQSKDIPCNLMATFQVNTEGRLDLTVFCRSNDIVFGTYFANAFHFSFLLEYMATKIGVPVGVYNQVSVNFHAYKATLNLFDDIPSSGSAIAARDPYQANIVHPTPFALNNGGDLDESFTVLSNYADRGFEGTTEPSRLWNKIAYRVLRAHEVFRNQGPNQAQEVLNPTGDPAIENYDLIWSMRLWLKKRAK